MSANTNLANLPLSNLQRKLITSALAATSLFVIGALLFLLFRLLSGFVHAFSNVLMPLAIAAILTMLLRPVVLAIESRSRLNRLQSIVCIFLLFTLGLVTTLWFLIPLLIEQTIQFVRAIPAIVDASRAIVEQRFPQLLQLLTDTFGEDRLAVLRTEAESQLTQSARSAAQHLALITQSYAVNLITTASAIAIIPVYLFYFLRANPISRDAVDRQLHWLHEDIREDGDFLVRQFVSSIESFFQGQILIGLIMGTLLAIGFSIADIKFGFLIGFTIGLLNIIPYLGTIIGLATVLPIAFLQPDGGIVLVLIALAIFIAVQVLEGYYLTPRIMGDRTGLHPLTIIIAIFFWGTALNGLLGMILAIPLTAFFVVFYRLLRDKYLPRLA